MSKSRGIVEIEQEMTTDKSLSGLASAISAYLMWGFTPIYFKALKAVPPFEILMHRMVWSFFLLILLAGLYKRIQALQRALTNWRILRILLGTTFLVGINWFLFIWAINNDRILDASLGYYFCPLVYVSMAALILRERLRRMQWVSVLLAATAVAYLTLTLGAFPWVALALALSFGLYGLIRKTAPVEALEGLAIETMFMAIPALIYLWRLGGHGEGSFLRISTHIDLLLLGTALITAIPLLFFNVGARRLNLATIGFLQYIGPSCSFGVAVFIYNEPLSISKLVSFGIIWTALALYSCDTVSHYRAARRLVDRRLQEKPYL